uniref:Cytokine like 1 n=1 Tax=Sphenodon punctatus TaxID=8508 RepID=A0A8D0GRW7_SPHPU
ICSVQRQVVTELLCAGKAPGCSEGQSSKPVHHHDLLLQEEIGTDHYRFGGVIGYTIMPVI